MKRWAFMERTDIRDKQTGDVYLTRWSLIRCPWFRIFLHRIRKPDPDIELHDHPWSFITFVLRGGYIEEVPESRKLSPWSCVVARPVRWFARKPVGLAGAHRISSVKPNTWTLVLAGPYRRTWGFYTRKGWISWRQFGGQADQ